MRGIALQTCGPHEISQQEQTQVLALPLLILKVWGRFQASLTRIKYKEPSIVPSSVLTFFLYLHRNWLLWNFKPEKNKVCDKPLLPGFWLLL